MLRKDFLKQQFLQHRWSYLVLLIELIIFVLLFMAAWPNRLLQRILIVFMMTFYVTWGSMTHFKTDRLTRMIFFEYLGISLLMGALLFFVTL